MKYSVILLLFVNLFYAQEEGEIAHAERYKYDPNYRVNYFDKKIYKMDIHFRTDRYVIPGILNNYDPESVLLANQKAKLRFSFDYSFLGVFFSIAPDFFVEDEATYGKTKTLDLSFNFFYSDRLRQEVLFRTIKGFYVSDINSVIPLALYPDMKINSYGGKTFYIINNNFSYRAFENMTERQVKSAGSIIPTVGYYFNNVQSPYTNPVAPTLINLDSFDFYVQAGYMYNYVLSKKWFVTGGAHPGLGLNYSKTTYSNPLNGEHSNRTVWSVNPHLNINFSIGYNNRNFFSGIKTNYKEYQFNEQENNEFANSRTYIEFFVGYRLKADKRLKKAFDYIENQLF